MNLATDAQLADFTMVSAKPGRVYCECAGLYINPEACRLCLPPANDNNPVAKRPRIIGLMGYAGSGKTTVANILRQDHNFQGPHIKAPLRAMCEVLLREVGVSPTLIDRYLDGDLKRETIPMLQRSGTELQQFLGTEFGREFCYADLWLDAWLRRVDYIMLSGSRIVQESVRFKNEADSIRSRGGIIVLVSRPGVGPINGHKSEVFPTTPDIEIENNGTIDDLRHRVDRIAA